MTDTMSAHEYTKQQMREAIDRFAKHRIVEETATSWRLRGPGSSNLWYFVTAHQGRVMVDGDVDPVGFLGYSGPSAPTDYVAWIGRHTDDVRYAAGKATRWWGSSKPFEERVPEVMLYDLAQMIARLERDAISEALREARGKKIKAAALLGISRPTLDKKIEDFQLVVEKRRQ